MPDRELACAHYRKYRHRFSRTPAFLAERLRLPPLEDGTVPLGLPFRISAGKAELERRLRAAGFEPPLSWEAPRDAPSDEADRLVVLPCDERMGERELARLVRICKTFSAERLAAR